MTKLTIKILLSKLLRNQNNKHNNHHQEMNMIILRNNKNNKIIKQIKIIFINQLHVMDVEYSQSSEIDINAQYVMILIIVITVKKIMTTTHLIHS